MEREPDKLLIGKMRSLFLGKRGQVQALAPTILALVFAAIILVFGIIMSSTLRDTDSLKTSTTVVNETGAWLNISGYTVDVEKSGQTEGYALTAIWANTPDGIPAYNYSIALANATVGDDGIVYNATAVTNASIYDNVSLTYTYLEGGEAWRGANNTVDGLGAFADFWEIIVLAVVITIVIGLLLVVFGGRRER